MLAVREYRSVPIRRVAVSPSRKAVMEVFVKSNSVTALSSESPELPEQNPPQPTKAATPDTSKPIVRQTARAASAGRKPLSTTPRRSPSPASVPKRPAAPEGTMLSLENFEEFEIIPVVLTSPRSIRACVECGIHPSELIPRSRDHFRGTAIPESVASMRYQHYESRRREKVAQLKLHRNKIIHPKDTPCGAIALRAPAPESKRHACVISEKNTKRQLIYERALKQKAEKEMASIQKQIEAEKRSREHRELCAEERRRIIEIRRMKFDDQRENIEHLKRQKEYRAYMKSLDLEAKQKYPIDKYRLSVAKEEYMTPRLRAERRRSASAQY